MEEVKYIPGDLVMTNGAPIGTKNGIAYVVTASDPDRTVTFEDGTVLKGSVTLDNIKGKDFKDNGYLFGASFAWVKHIIPIPLTPKILEANGWKTQNKWYYFLDIRKGFISDIGIDFIHKSPKDNLYVEVNGNNMAEIQYCHQVQHLLFGLGLYCNLKV